MESEAEARCICAALRPRDPDLADEWNFEVANRVLEIREAREFASHFAILRRKYERAASRPWEPVAPDPREPRHVHIWRCTPLPKEPLPPGERWYAEDSARRRVTAARADGRGDVERMVGILSKPEC